MGVTKKATVVAKTATKKRGRPAGSKNKPLSLSSEGWVPSTVFANSKEKKVDWEKLAKRLQEALAAEMKENEALKNLLEEFKAVIRIDSSFTFWDRFVFLFTGKINGNKSV